VSGRRWRLAAALAATLLAVGCSRAQRNEDFTPSEVASRAALEAYLRAWSRGDTATTVPDTQPPVMVADNLRTQGRTLAGYKVLGEVPADAPRCFAVQLSLGNPAAEVRERYVVVGIDPLWVWRYDDYLMITHWSHPMPADQKAAPPKR
jgi:hypothetical protein